MMRPFQLRFSVRKRQQGQEPSNAAVSDHGNQETLPLATTMVQQHALMATTGSPSGGAGVGPAWTWRGPGVDLGEGLE